MKLLHTADWHLGKRLYGVDRRDEAVAALAELAALAADERVDAVLMAGDLLDRRVMDAEPLGDTLRALEALADTAPVLVVVGNHDDPGLWTALAPYLERRRIHVAGRARPPAEAVRTVETASGPLHAALLPWPDPGRFVADLGEAVAETKRSYADQVARVLALYAEEVTRRQAAEGGAGVLVAHLMVDGAVGGGGERELTMGITYAVSPHAVPTGLDYVALGHVHKPQAVPGVAVPARYSGSPMAIDFSEDNHGKTACLVHIERARTTVREVALEASRPLVRLRGPLDALPGLAAEHPDAWFLCEVLLDEPVLDLSRQVRDRVPGVLRVEPVHAGVEAGSAAPTAAPGDAPAVSVAEQYADWYAVRGRPLGDALRRALAEAMAAAAGSDTA